MPIFWPVFSSKNFYEINENTNFSPKKTLPVDHHLLRRYAFDKNHLRGPYNNSYMASVVTANSDYLIYLLQRLGFLINIKKSALKHASTLEIL